MGKFRVGDKVIGNEKARNYSITHTGWVGTVIDTRISNGDEQIRVTDYVDPENSQGIGFLRISDNGLGMRLQEDVVGKWLVLATESKFAKKADGGWAEFATEEQRKWLKTSYGEKGIGRLSVASL